MPGPEPPRSTLPETVLWAALVVDVSVHLVSLVPILHMRLERLQPVLFLVMAISMVGVTRNLLSAATATRAERQARLRAAPVWVKVGVLVSFAYSAAVFVYQTRTFAGRPVATIDGYFLKDRGELVKAISEAEYWAASRAELTLFTGLMLFFAFFGAVGYAYSFAPRDDVERD
jgi:hypothetical protein